MKSTIKIQHGNNEKSVVAEIIDRQIWFKVDGVMYSQNLIDLEESAGRRNSSSKISADKITAAMPGKVTKIFVSEGQNINRGDVLIIMEAMKMEYSLKSDMNGVVKNLAVKLNDQVSLGQVLIKLEEIK
jgi:biotin carboxyl carrier protein